MDLDGGEGVWVLPPSPEVTVEVAAGVQPQAGGRGVALGLVRASARAAAVMPLPESCTFPTLFSLCDRLDWSLEEEEAEFGGEVEVEGVEGGG